MEEATYVKGALVGTRTYKERMRHACALMKKADLDALLLTKPQSMMYLVGDGRLCAFTILSQKGESFVGVPKTNLEDVKAPCFTVLHKQIRWCRS